MARRGEISDRTKSGLPHQRGRNWIKTWTDDAVIQKIAKMKSFVVVLPDPFEGWGRGGTPRRPSSRATPEGLNQRSKMEEVVPKMACRRGSDAYL